MNAIYEFFNLFGIQNIALTIIIFTFFVRALMLPLTIKQQKFTKMSSVMNPELQKIQAKYKGKKDQASMQKQQLETQAVYQKYGANPTSGCLPLLITLPIMFALYAVIYNIPAYVNQVYHLYEGIANQVLVTSDYQTLLTTLAETVKNSRLKIPTDMTTARSVIDVLKYFTQDTWTAFATSFPDIQNSAANGSLTVAESINKLASINTFLGFNIANAPGMKLSPALIIPVLAGGLQYIQGKQISVKNKDMNQDNPAASAMNSMNVVMPIMSAFFCITFPIGVGIYWIASSAFAIVQQFFVNKYMDRVDVNDLIAKNVAKQKKKNAYMESKGISMSDLAKTQTKNIENTASEKVSKADPAEKNEEEPVVDIKKKTTNSSNSKSISDIANLLNNKNDKGEK
jgi:YidC/Oxa1 family membrane protein insertase